MFAFYKKKHFEKKPTKWKKFEIYFIKEKTLVLNKKNNKTEWFNNNKKKMQERHYLHNWFFGGQKWVFEKRKTQKLCEN